MTLAASARDQLAELGDSRGMFRDPILDAAVDVGTAAAREELNAELLEIPRKAGREQPLPLVGGNETRNLLLRPVEAERFAEPRVGARRFELIELVARSERGDAEHAVQLIKADKPANDVVAGAERDEPVAARSRFIANLRADQSGSSCGDFANAGLKQRAELFNACIATAGTQNVRQVRANARRSDRENLNAHGFRQVVLLDLLPQLVEIEQALGDQECGNDLLQRCAFFFGEIEGDTWSEAVDKPVGDFRGDELIAQPVGADRLGMRLPAAQ